jgi:hypothetical protein
MLASSAARLAEQRQLPWDLTNYDGRIYLRFKTSAGTYWLPVDDDQKVDGEVATAILTSRSSTQPPKQKPPMFYPPGTRGAHL